MIKELKYNGYTAGTSELECADGDLATAINVITENGSLVPIAAPNEIFSLQSDQKVLFVHKASDYCNYIVKETQGMSVSFYPFIGTEAKDPILTLEEGEEYVDINAIGKILVISTSKHLHYIRWKDGEYIYLGTQIPDVRIEFGLDTEAKMLRHPVKYELGDNLTESKEYDEPFYSDTGNFLEYTEHKWNGYRIFSRNFQLTTKIEKGVEYKIECNKPLVTGWLIGRFVVYDRNGRIIAKTNGKEYKSYVIFTASENVSDITILLGISGIGVGHAVTVNVNIFKGQESATTEKVITYNSSNYDAVMGAANSFVDRFSIKGNKFIYPFFVRYAIKLSDGSYGRISDPILLVPNSGYTPIIKYSYKESLYSNLYSFVSDIQYKICNEISNLWDDIISGVDFFVSQPAYAYKQGENFQEDKSLFEFLNSTDIKGTNLTASLAGDITTDGQSTSDLYDIICSKFDFASQELQKCGVVRIAKNDDQIETLAKTGTFYLIKSIEKKDLEVMDDYATLNMDEGTLSSLTSRATLPDNVTSRYSYKNAHLTSYNQRLHLFDYEMTLAKPTSPKCANGVSYGFAYNESNAILYKAIVDIRTSDGERSVELTSDGTEKYLNQTFNWFFYPHNGAYRLRLYFTQEGEEPTSYGTTYKEIELTQHKTLNGAYWIADELAKEKPMLGVYFGLDEPKVVCNNVVSRPASIQQSAVNAPYNFQASSLSTLDVQKVLGLSSAAKALSQGQFGQFPLYAFTTDGVWALEVSSTGTYTTKQPITRDVCTNVEGITQLDSEVIFPTDRGLMLLSGSNTTCFSEALNAEFPFDISTLPGYETMHNMLEGHSSDDIKNCLVTLPFTDFLKQCRIIYDYAHQRLLVYAPGKSYTYVYSLKSQSWGMTDFTVDHHPLSYPDAIAVSAQGKLVNFSEANTNGNHVFYITRPLKLDEPFIYKTIDTLIQRGVFQSGHLATVLYGSRDLRHWSIVWSSKSHYLGGFRGTGYKYFRIAGVGELDGDESVYGASIQFNPRETNRLR